MNNLIFILSFPLLSFPVIGNSHKGETLYGWGEYLPYVWKGFGDKETHPKYEGDVENGVPNGQGTFTYPDGMKYVGGWKNGEMIGQGTFTYPYGKKYFGRFKGGRKNGQGTYTWSDGRKYIGEFKDNKKDGQGTYTWSDGTKYVGEFKDDIRWNGTRYEKNGNIIEKWVNGNWIKQ